MRSEHAAMVAAAGMFNGAVIDGHAIKGSTIKRIEKDSRSIRISPTSGQGKAKSAPKSQPVPKTTTPAAPKEPKAPKVPITTRIRSRFAAIPWQVWRTLAGLIVLAFRRMEGRQPRRTA